MPKGVYVRTEEIRQKMRLSHQRGWISTYKKKQASFTRTGIPTEISKAMRGYTKWGGPNHGFMTVTPDWHCQSCKRQQNEHLPDYRIKITNGEYARICSICYHTMLMNRVTNIFDLINLVRNTEIEFG